MMAWQATPAVVTTMTYDGMGRTKQVTDPLSHVGQTSYNIICNAAGTSDAACYEQTLATDPNSHRQGTLVDGLGRKIYAQRYTGNATYTLYSTPRRRCCIHGTQGCLKLRGKFICFYEIEEAKLLIAHLRRAGYTASDRVERYLPPEAYVWLNCWKRPRQRRSMRPVPPVS